LHDRHRSCCSKCPVSDQPSIPFLDWRLESTPRSDSVTFGSDLKPKMDSWEQREQDKTLHANDFPHSKAHQKRIYWSSVNQEKVFCIMNLRLLCPLSILLT
jgi:hypothetical protein